MTPGWSRKHALTLALLLGASCAQAEVMLQWFETEWDEMYRRMPEVAQFGYDYIWTPPPTKAPTGLGTKWGNVGYNLYDRFDLGDVPQRGSWATRYGTRGSLRNMVDTAHQCDVKIIPDIIMNHNGNGPDFRSYPAMKPEDFHVQWEQGHCNTLNYKRGPRMDQWYHGEGYGGTMWQELVNLIDIRTEPDNRFTGGNNTPGWSFVSGTSYLRHPGQYDRYPYYGVDPNTYSNETAAGLLHRWIAWLGNATDYDGLRLDAGKHTPWEFFGQKGAGFLHEAQYNYNQRRGYSDSSSDEADQLFQNYVRRNDALIFAEILSYQSELAYWLGGQLTSPANCTRNPMRFLDYPLKQRLYSAFSNGDLASLTAGGGGITPELGIMYAWGHDEAGPSKINLAYAYILTHVGFPMVYFTGNNITWSDNGTKTWMRPGYDSQALGDGANDIRNLVWIHQQFARGKEYDRWNEGDFFAYERYDDDGDSTPEEGEGVLLIGLNDSGYDLTKNGITVSFPVGTVLHDYTGHNPADATVYNSGGPKVNITVPGGGGQGWVCYAPRNAEGVAGDSIQVKDNGSAAGTIPWVVPGGLHASAKTQQITRVTSTNLSLDVYFNPTGGTVNSVMIKWGQGKCRLSATNVFDTGNSIVSGGYEKIWQRNSTNWYLDIQVGATNIPEGLNVLKARVFNQRGLGLPALYNTFTKLIYVDTRGPQLDIAHPAEGQTVYGDAVMLITNRDFTAYGMTVSVDGGAPQSAHEIMKGLWKYGLVGLSQGTHTAVVTATEADWDATRQAINTSLYTRVFNVVTNQNPVSLNHADGATQYLPFFQTVVTAPGSPSSVRLYWDGYELLMNGGSYTNVFNGQVLFRDASSTVTDRLWGAFVNGQHFFEAVRVDAGVTSRCVRRVLFNLYATNAIDSDGDSIPDNVEMPFIDSDGAPGADAPWPGDSNKDFVPNYGETWTKLNPYNHSTYYSSQWDDRNDFDGDGFNNGEEVLAGYSEGNIYKYSIYSASSKPAGSPSEDSGSAIWTPEYAEHSNTLTVTFSPNDGPLKGISPVYMHVGHSKKTAGSWQQVQGVLMTPSGTNWVGAYAVPTNATSVDFCFRDSASNDWDNNSGNDWQARVAGVTSSVNFAMDGLFDSTNYTVFGDNMKILAAVNGDNLYVATWATHSPSDDHFVYVTDEIGDAVPTPWSKTGVVYFAASQKPFISAEGNSGWCCWNNVSARLTNRNVDGYALEGQVNLVTAFGHVPEAVYIAAVAYGTDNATGLLDSQGPYAWEADNDVDAPEFLRVPIASVRDEDLDGVYDLGKPQMWTVVNGNTNDANYGLRRFFLNELAGDSETLTVILQPNAGTGVVTDVELFSNLNRRDFAVMPGDEDPSTVNASSKTTYYRAYPMTALGGGRYSVTLPVNKCGAYRINARYRVNGGAYVYYTDGGLRRDCAAVVSPKKALQLSMYEINPLAAEATGDGFSGRSTFEDMYIANMDRYDAVNTNHFTGIGANMVWLQPIHPIGSEGQPPDPATGSPYDPGSPYAVRNYWSVNGVLGDPYTADGSRAMLEFTNFVQALDGVGVGVMLDGTFNHSAWDCEIGEYGVEMGLTYTNITGAVVAVQASDLIRSVRPQWYSRKNDYGSHATYYQSGGNNDIATAPDRVDFGKWTDVADFFFGEYDALVQRAPAQPDTNWWRSAWQQHYLFEEDRFEGLDAYTRELWQYFAHYPVYWLEKTGHPEGTPKSESNKGIDGLRCDFAQGLPSAFWEYCINKTRSVKWDFIFMAESLDGSRTVGGSKRHGVGYRSGRHFDVLNENMIFHWRDTFFKYPYEGPGGPNDGQTPDPTTGPTAAAFDDRRQAFDNAPVLLDLSCHDEVYPSDDPYRLVYAHAICAAMDGVPMLFYGQEAGAQNDNNIQAGVTSYDHNFNRYEVNFNKSIPNFKRYNCMSNVWAHRDWNVQNIYGRINRARLDSPALMSQQNYFLNRTDTGQKDPDITGIARFEIPGVSAASQDVVFVFVNNNYWASTNRGATYFLNTNYSNGRNWFGIESGHSYNIVDLMSSTPTNYVWTNDVAGSTLLSGGLGVWLHESPYDGKQAQYLRLIDRTAGITPTNRLNYYAWDKDRDGLPDSWETANGLDPNNGSGDEGAGGDKDHDGQSNMDELWASTHPNDTNDLLEVDIAMNGGVPTVSWPGKTNVNYRVERTDGLAPASSWQGLYFGTALSANEEVTDNSTSAITSRFYRVMVKP